MIRNHFPLDNFIYVHKTMMKKNYNVDNDPERVNMSAIKYQWIELFTL